MKKVIEVNGVNHYPVCKWTENQHKIYNYNDKMAIAWHNDRDNDEKYEKFIESERLLEVFNWVVVDGLVYASYEDSKKLKDIIGWYDMKH